MAERTEAEKLVAEEVARVLGEGKRWRAAVLIVSYKRPTDGERDVHLANAFAMRNKEAALDVVMMIKRLRTLADELDQVVRGERPLPEQEG